MATIEFKLANPVEIDGVMRDSIELRTLKAADLAAVDRLNARMEVRAMKLTTILTGLDRTSLAEISLFNPGVLSKISDIVAQQVSAVSRG